MSLEMSVSPINIKLNWIERLRGLFAVIIAYIALKTLSLSTISIIISIAKSRCFREVDINEANIAWGAVRKTSFFFLGRAACMELSLAFVFFALTKGLSSTWCMGVANEPFKAHAWIEIAGKPFREDEYLEQNFQKLLVV